MTIEPYFMVPQCYNLAIPANYESNPDIMNTQHANPADEVMCSCSGTKREHIRKLFEQGLDIDAISRNTGAISGCGGCEWDIAGFLEALAQQKKEKGQGG